MSSATIIFPHQLFKENPVFKFTDTVYLVEEYLFFTQYKFHKTKIAFHRASMMSYKDRIEAEGKNVIYIQAQEDRSDIRCLLKELNASAIEHLYLIDPTDNWLQKHIEKAKDTIKISWIENPLFLNTTLQLKPFFKSDKRKFFQTSFYKQQRKERRILMDGDQPIGGQWTYDKENRKKYPKTKVPPPIWFPEITDHHKEAIDYVKSHFNSNYGKISKEFIYPIDHDTSKQWFEQFLEYRFLEFGPYEDAIVREVSILHHSLLSPLLNVGLLTPQYVIDKAIEFANKNNIPINSLEGFVRQILGWREFIRGIYEVKGTEERTTNFWGFDRKIPQSFYDGTTGIAPIDDTIKKVLDTGYAHHIERLMILGNFMLLCEFEPNEVYKWFMELFIDAYDWVMVPNVYGMSLFADGGMMSTKPYISGSNYIMKMSNYSKGSWQEIWDALFWNFMDKHRTFFYKNPRLSMLIRTFDKKPLEQRETYLNTANIYLNTLSS